MVTKLGKPLGQTIAAAAFALSLLVAAGGATHVGAEPVEPGGNSFQRECKALQDQAQGLVDEYKNAGNSRREDILNELRSIGTTWRQVGCQGVWGNILIELPPGAGDLSHELGSVGSGDLQATDGGGAAPAQPTAPSAATPLHPAGHKHHKPKRHAK